jgi:hypothetical protein
MFRVAAGTATGSSRALWGAWFVLHWLEFWFSENPWIDMVYPVHYTGKYWKHLSTFWSWMRMETCPPTASCRRAPQGAEIPKFMKKWRLQNHYQTWLLNQFNKSREILRKSMKISIPQTWHLPIFRRFRLPTYHLCWGCCEVGTLCPPWICSASWCYLAFIFGTANLCPPPSRTLRPSRHAMWSASRCSRSLDWSDLVHPRAVVDCKPTSLPHPQTFKNSSQQLYFQVASFQ